MPFYVSLIMLGFVGHVFSTEYQIREKTIPSYLHHSFYNISDDIFPSDFSFQISLSKILGTLFYSIDSRSNQLIISLSDATPPTLSIEFSNQHKYISLSELCGCIRCRYEKLRFRIQMGESIHLQCNKAPIISNRLEFSKKLNKDYPIPIYNASQRLHADVWLINTPAFNNLNPNSEQTIGCIFGVWYQGQPLEMTAIGMKRKCPITCKNDVCNNGECFETYNSHPVCNCTASFNNGPFCNKTLLSGNYEVSGSSQFKVIKFSFKSIFKDLLVLKNSEIKISILADQENLIFKLSSNVSYSMESQCIITRKYRNEDENILIMVFEETFIEVKFGGNKSNWVYLRIPHSKDLSKVIFDLVTIRGETGSIGLVFKDGINDYKWREMDFQKSFISTEKSNKTVNIITKTDVSNTKQSAKQEYLELEKERHLIKRISEKVDIITILSSTSILITLVVGIVILYYNCVWQIYRKKRNHCFL